MTRSDPSRLLVWGLLFALGCSSGGSGCSGCTEPIPGGFPDGTGGRSDLRARNAAGAKLTEHGLRFLESRVNEIVGLLATQGLQFDVPCVDQTQHFNLPGWVTGLGVPDSLPVFACDVNEDSQCNATDGAARGPDDHQSATAPPQRLCQATAAIRTLRINPVQAADGTVNVAVLLELRVNTGRIPLFVDMWICALRCSLEYDTNANAPENLPINVAINLKLDPDHGDVLAFDVQDVDVTNIFQTSDLRLDDGSGVCSWIACNALDLDFVKQMIVNFLKGTINSKVKDIVDTMRCMPCEAGTNNCPQGSTCDTGQKVCYSDRAARKCPPTLLGMTGRAGVGSALASFGGPPDAKLDFYVVAGGRDPPTVPPNPAYPNGAPSIHVTGEHGGIKMGLMGGTDAPVVSSCVPPRTFTWPPLQPPGPVDFDTEANAAQISVYDLGLSISGVFVNKGMFDAYQAGVLCLNVDSSVSTFLSASLFRTFLPSLRVLTHEQDVPMLVALRPRNAPSVRIGKGTIRPGSDIPDDPLLTVTLRDVQLDFYAFLEERYSRLFSLTADLSLPLSLRFNAAANTVKPVLGNLASALTNVRPSNSEMLAEDPQVVADLLKAIIGLIEPVLASVLTPIELPTFQGFKVEIEDARGVVPLPGGAGYQHLALFAKLDLAPQHPMVAQVHTTVRIAESSVPDAEGARAGIAPVLVLEADADGPQPAGFAGWEFTWRADGGLWSPWVRGPRIPVTAPVLRLQGRHVVEVAAHAVGLRDFDDRDPARVTFLVDYEPPDVRLDADPETREIRTVASDAVTPADALSFRYRVDGIWQAPGRAATFRAAEATRLEVEATDESGRVGRAVYGPADEPRAIAPGAGVGAPSAGCAGVDAGVSALAALAWRARRRRKG